MATALPLGAGRLAGAVHPGVWRSAIESDSRMGSVPRCRQQYGVAAACLARCICAARRGHDRQDTGYSPP